MEAALAKNVAQYPVSIIEDRYSGVYSGGEWIAIASADDHLADFSEPAWILSRGPWGDDRDAAGFWSDPPEWIAVGPTPNDALAALEVKLLA